MPTSYDISDQIAAGYTLEPLKCRACGDESGNVVYSQAAGDATCQNCGAWQLDTPKPRPAFVDPSKAPKGFQVVRRGKRWQW